MRPEIDLVLLTDSIASLLETPYFDKKIEEFLEELKLVVTHSLQAAPPYPPAILSDLSRLVWRSHSYLQGSTSRDIPYELTYCLEHALRDWIPAGGLITTRLTDDKDFHLWPVDPWDLIQTAIPSYRSSKPHLPLVLIGLPRLYCHKPLFCIPLYHELGHYVDTTLGITNHYLLGLIHKGSINPANQQLMFQTRNHLREHFADVFAAMYTGTATTSVLETIAPNNPDTMSHPSTSKRKSLVTDFLNGTPNAILTELQNSTYAQTKRHLILSFQIPNIVTDFDEVRPSDLQSIQEVHGLFQVAWDYLIEGLDYGKHPWCQNSVYSKPEIVSIVNDLVEKTIRNFATSRAWNNATTN